MNTIKLTIFTPTFNRGSLISNLYYSLLNQNNFSFEWIIINDGSTDNTDQIINFFLNKKNPFPIVYLKQKNIGKQNSWNKAVKLAKGEYFCCIDSDDYLLNNTTQTIIDKMNSINDNESIIGCSFLDLNKEGDVLGKSGKYKTEYIDLKTHQRSKYGLIADQTEIFKTNLLKKFKFPNIEKENFIPEGYLYNLIEIEGYKYRFFKIPLIVHEYFNDGLSANLNSYIKNNPISYLLYLQSNILIYRKEHSILKKYSTILYSKKLFNSKFKASLIYESLKLTKFEIFFITLFFYPLKFFDFVFKHLRPSYLYQKIKKNSILKFVKSLFESFYFKLFYLVKSRGKKKSLENTIKFKKIYLLSSQHTLSYSRVLCKIVESLGYQAILINDENESLIKFQKYLYIVLNPITHKKLPAAYIAYNFEQSTWQQWWSKKYFALLKNAIGIYDYSKANLSFLLDKLKYSKIFYVPVCGELFPKKIKNIPILFYGTSFHPRRKRILNRLKIDLHNKIYIQDWMFGEKILNILDDSKFVINIHCKTNAVLETLRIFECLSHNVVVISENSDNSLDDSYFDDVVIFFNKENYDELYSKLKTIETNPIKYSNIVNKYNEFLGFAMKNTKESIKSSFKKLGLL